MVRSFLGGSFANTAFCILAPDGKTRLSGSGRGPSQALLREGPGRRGGAETQAGDEAVVGKLKSIASGYRPSGIADEAVPQDFHSFRQALNVASGDQRLLVAVAAPEGARGDLRAKLGPVFADDEIIGRFHLDFIDAADDAGWEDTIERASGQPGIYIIRADQFGQEGTAIEKLSLESDGESLKGALLAANLAFSVSEERKDYASHVSDGRRNRIYFENGMPYGEDRDGDGVIDHGGAPKRGGEGPAGRGSKGSKGAKGR